jgi:aspartoacylase
LASLPHESVRAREIEGLLGPKFTTTEQQSSHGEDSPSSHNNNNNNIINSNVDPKTCVVIDLHTTTSNMGITLIIPEGDALMSAAAAYVLHKCQERYGNQEAQCVMHALPQRQDRMNLSSCGRHGFTIEVGPTPQGVLRHDVVEKTETALHALLEFLHLCNMDQKKDEDDETSPSVLRQLQRIYPNGIVPCYRSAPAVRPGELSGKIAWPNDDSNPNFPKWMIHKSVQDRDFEPLRVGDPLFVELDGTIVPYDGSHGDEVYLIFVNEGGYYYSSSGTGVGVAVRSQFDLQTGE